MLTNLILAAVFTTQAQTAPPKPVLSPEQQALSLANEKVAALRTQLKANPKPKEKSKLKKALTHAESRAREAREYAALSQLQQEQAAYVAKMMPIWQEQQRQNVQFSIEAAKASAMQSMAATARRKAQYDVYNQMQQNQIMADEARSLRRMAQP